MLELKRVNSLVRLTLTFLLAMTVQTPSLAQELTLGEIEFPTSGTPEAQKEFIQGMLYMHSFEYDPAAVAFRKAQAIDPDFAMAFWGEAMTNHHSLWRVQDQQGAQTILNRLGSTSEERAAKAPTQREKDFIHAAEMQASLPFRYGPPRISKPTTELLADLLYELGDDAGAILAYQDQLSRSKLRTNSLIGLARATARIGDDTTSQEAYDSLANIWHSADESVAGLAEVKRLTRRD